jgi:hypothetical protein
VGDSFIFILKTMSDFHNFAGGAASSGATCLCTHIQAPERFEDKQQATVRHHVVGYSFIFILKTMSD